MINKINIIIYKDLVLIFYYIINNILNKLLVLKHFKITKLFLFFQNLIKNIMIFFKVSFYIFLSYLANLVFNYLL